MKVCQNPSFISTPKRKPIEKEIRNLKHFEAEKFVSDLNSAPWSLVNDHQDPNTAWDVWKAMFNGFLDKHAPI